MKNFGYTALADKTIDYDLRDRRMAIVLESQEPSIRLCIGCGSCTATCSAGTFTSFNIRRIHTYLRRGETQQARLELRKCMFCGKCQLVCPRGVNLRNVILTIYQAIEQIG